MHQPGERLRPTPDLAYAGRPFDATPTARDNPAALLGAALSPVPVLGAVLSILGLVRTQTLGGAGRTVATIGLALSIAFTAGEAYAVYELSDTNASADPACVAMRSDMDALQARLNTVTSGTTSAATAASALVTYLRSVKSALERNISRATRADVRIGLQAFDADLGTLISSVRQVEGGDEAAIGLMQVTVAKLRADGQSIDALCDGARS